MSVQNLLGDVFSGNFSNAFKRVEDWWSGVSPSVKAFIAKEETDQGKILMSVAETGAADVLANGLTTASFVAAAADMGTKLTAQEITFAKTDIFAALNMEVGKLQSQSTGAASAASTAAPAASASTGTVDNPVT